jgi:hypothetical protein
MGSKEEISSKHLNIKTTQNSNKFSKEIYFGKDTHNKKNDKKK